MTCFQYHLFVFKKDKLNTVFLFPSSSCAGQILFSADDEMEDSDGDDDVRRLTGLKPVKKKKHRLGIPV